VNERPATCLGPACCELCFLAVNLGDTAADNARRGQMSTQSCIAIRQQSSHSVLRKLSSVRSFIAPHFCPPAFRCLKSGRWRARKTTCSSTTQALAQALGEKNVALMRGHGNVVVASRLRLAVSRAIETEVNAKLQLQSMMIGGPINYLSAKEAESLEVDLVRTKPSDARGADRVWEGLKRLVQSPA
jgi:hypothetical protein